MPHLRATITLAMFSGAASMLSQPTERLHDFANWFARPARLPFAWQGLNAAYRSGDAGEAFARGQQILDLAPSWTIGHAAFAYRYVLSQDMRGSATEQAKQAERRLIVALAWLEGARQHAGKREAELLHSAAFLAPIACGQFPGLEARLPAGGAPAISDHFFAEAERLFPSPVTREQRLYHVPTLAGALLSAGQRRQAIELLKAAIEQAPEARDQELAAEWRDRIAEIVRALSGDSTTLKAVFDDQRFEPLWPHLR